MVVPQKLEMQLFSSNCTTGVYLKNTKTLNQRLVFPLMFIAAFTIAKFFKHPKCLSIDEWIKKMGHTHTHTYTHTHTGMLFSHEKE